jgi:hypothetical protein
MSTRRSLPAPPIRPTTLLVLLCAALLAIGLLLHLGLGTQEFGLPAFRGRMILDRLYGLCAGIFFVYMGFRLLRPDVARNWSERDVAQERFLAKVWRRPMPNFSVEDRLPMWERSAKTFSIVSFVAGGCVLMYETVTLFVG